MNISVIVALFIVISVVAITAKVIRIPYTPALVLAGTVLGLFNVMPSVHFSPELLFTILLPPILFEGAVHLSWHELKKASSIIFILAVPGVLVSIFLLAPLFHHFFLWPLSASFLFASLLAATDPIAVLNAFKSLKAPKGLSVIVEGESLFNDGVAIVAFSVILAVIQQGSWHTGTMVFKFFALSTGGLAIGILLALALTLIARQFKDHQIEITLSTVLAYGSYMAADSLHLSGVMSVIGAGLVYGNMAAQLGFSGEVRTAILDFWDYVGFLANSLVFVLIGTQINSQQIFGYWKAIGVVYLLLMATRLVIVPLTKAVASIMGVSFRFTWVAAAWWGGLRGALSLALAMTLMDAVPQGKDFYFITLGVVILFLFLNGLTMSPLLHKLKP